MIIIICNDWARSCQINGSGIENQTPFKLQSMCMKANAVTTTTTAARVAATREIRIFYANVECFKMMGKFVSTHRHYQFIEITLNNHLIKKHEIPPKCELKTAKYYAPQMRAHSNTHTHIKLSFLFEICDS